MKIKHSPSINILRDENNIVDYISSNNTKKIANQILNEFDSGIHSFNIIGSYGTGKSSFLWALNQSLSKDSKHDFFDLNNKRDVKTLNIVGEYSSLSKYFINYFSLKESNNSYKQIFNFIYQEYESIKGNNGLLIICIDEFGKFLEYAAKNNPEKEMYFIQQLSEFVNDPKRNILLITSVHQAIDSYAFSLNDTQKSEWKKVKGRLKEIPFNEPVEHLLFLASQFFKSNYNKKNKDLNYIKGLVDLNYKNHCFNISEDNLEKLGIDLYPLDLFAGITLTKALQRYGQNERSLFTFLTSSDNLGIDSLKENDLFTIAKVYDYLFVNLYTVIKDKYNPDYSSWSLTSDKLNEIESKFDANINTASDIVKTIGLLNIFSNKGASINEQLLIQYLSFKYSPNKIKKVANQLVSFKMIRFSSYYNSFKLTGGMDMDIEQEIIRVSNHIDISFDIVPKLKKYFSFPILTANEFSFKTGTPRLFEFKISENLLFETPEDEIDGFINLVFNETYDNSFFIEKTKQKELPTLYAHYTNTDKIRETLIEITKTEKVLKEADTEDKVARKELKSIINSQEKLLNHYVLDNLFGKYTRWYFNGKEITISSRNALNKYLSKICYTIYPLTPTINMELINKHKVSGAINSARKQYFKKLVHQWHEKDLGYPKDKFPADKTIYSCLVKNTGIHQQNGETYILSKPELRNDNFVQVWNACEDFLKEARKEEKNIVELINRLKQKPYKLKQGVIDFLVPTFLFTKRGDFALYNGKSGYVPYIDESILYLFTRQPKDYSIKTFELSNLHIDLFNKYREYLNQSPKDSLSNDSFIESIRPFLILYKNLEPYSQKTKRLTKEAIQLRQAIVNAEDPEKVFFENFPKALNYDLKSLVESEKLFDTYIHDLQKHISEIKNSIEELINRFETYLVKNVLGVNLKFPDYKNIIQERFSSLEEHQLLPNQKKFLIRVNSNLDDRNSWLNSIAFALLTKPLKDINDKDEDILKDRLSSAIKELDNLCDIYKLKAQSNEEVYKIDITSKQEGLKQQLIRISKDKKKEVEKNISLVRENLGSDKQVRLAILTELLKRELNE